MVLGCRKAPNKLIVTFRELTKYPRIIRQTNKISNIYHNKNISNKHLNNNRFFHLLKVQRGYQSLMEALHRQRIKQVIRWERQHRVSSLEGQARIELYILLSQM